jgi:hypothetical protein
VKTGMGHKWVRNYCLNWGAYFQFEGIYWSMVYSLDYLAGLL